MISNTKRVRRLQKEIYKRKGNPRYSKFIIRASDGLFLFQSSNTVMRGHDKYTLIKEPIQGIQIVDCEGCSIKELLIVGDGISEPVLIEDDIPFADDVAEGYLKDRANPFKDLSTDKLKEIAQF